MPDSNLVNTAIQSHTAALTGAVQQHSANAVRCKVWSAGVMAGVLIFTPGKVQVTALPWMLGVLALLAVADACCVAMARIGTEACNDFLRKLPLNGGNMPNPSTHAQGKRAEEWLVLPAPDPGLRQAGSVFRALGSFSVWPFYGAMLALVAAFYVQAAGEAARLAAKTTSRPPQPAPVSAALPMKPGPLPAQPGAAGSPSGAKTAQPGQFVQPKQPGALFPLRTSTPPPPGARPLLVPTRTQPPGTPSTGLPAKPPTPAAAPPNAVPQPTGTSVPNGVPPPNAIPVPAPATSGRPALPPAPPVPSAPSPEAPAAPSGTPPAK